MNFLFQLPLLRRPRKALSVRTLSILVNSHRGLCICLLQPVRGKSGRRVRPSSKIQELHQRQQVSTLVRESLNQEKKLKEQQKIKLKKLMDKLPRQA
jgi:hypothetical protein